MWSRNIWNKVSISIGEQGKKVKESSKLLMTELEM